MPCSTIPSPAARQQQQQVRQKNPNQKKLRAARLASPQACIQLCTLVGEIIDSDCHMIMDNSWVFASPPSVPFSVCLAVLLCTAVLQFWPVALSQAYRSLAVTRQHTHTHTPQEWVCISWPPRHNNGSCHPTLITHSPVSSELRRHQYQMTSFHPVALQPFSPAHRAPPRRCPLPLHLRPQSWIRDRTQAAGKKIRNVNHR